MGQGNPEPTSLGTRVTRGTVWGAANMSVARTLQFVTTIIVARILVPEDFGVLAVALVVQTIATNMAELGATASLARGNGDPDKIAPTVFSISLLTSVALTGVCIALAPGLAALFGSPTATAAIQVMSLTILLQGLSAVPATMVWREFLQKPRMMVDLANLIVVLILVVPMAHAGWGAMALVWSRVGGQLVATIGYWIISPKRYFPGFNHKIAAEVLRLGLPLAVANLLVFVTLNLDYLFIGRILGPLELGLYLMAFNLAGLPSAVITSIIRTVAVPMFGRLHDRGTLGAAAGTFVGAVSFAAFPVSALLVILGLPLITTFYGQNWAPAAAAMAGLGIFGAARVLIELFGDMCVGGGRTMGLLWVQVIWLVVLAPALFFGVQTAGIAGAGFAHMLVATFVVVPGYLLALRPVVGIGWGKLLRGAVYPAFTAIVAAVVAWIAVSSCSLPEIIDIFLGVGTLTVVYAALNVGHGRRLFAQLRSTLFLVESADELSAIDPENIRKPSDSSTSITETMPLGEKL